LPISLKKDGFPKVAPQRNTVQLIPLERKRENADSTKSN
jgi:hypothetical protein